MVCRFHILLSVCLDCWTCHAVDLNLVLTPQRLGLFTVSIHEHCGLGPDFSHLE